MTTPVERTEFTVGEEATLTRTIGHAEIAGFAALTGDDNPVHLDEAYASRSYFKGRIAHGMLAAGLISAVLGTRLPGPGAVYLSQSLRFKAPVRPGDRVTARAAVTAWDSATGRVTLSTEVMNQDGETVLTGEATLVMSARLGGR